MISYATFGSKKLLLTIHSLAFSYHIEIRLEIEQRVMYKCLQWVESSRLTKTKSCLLRDWEMSQKYLCEPLVARVICGPRISPFCIQTMDAKRAMLTVSMVMYVRAYMVV